MIEDVKRIPYGVSNFVEVVEQNQYYVDSSIKGHKVCANGPHVHEYIQEMNQKVFSRKELLTVGETPAVTIEDGKKYAPLDNSELCMIFQFELMDVDGGETNKWSDQRFVLKDLKQIMSRWQEGMYQKDWKHRCTRGTNKIK